MRATVLVAIGLLAGAGLSGCDRTPAPQQQTAQVAPAAPVPPPPCNCGERAAPDNQMTRLSYVPRHRHRAYREWGYHGSGTSRSGQSVVTYDYVSASHVSYSESSESYENGGSYVSGGYEANGYTAHGHRYYPNGIVWVDGYGRGYFAGQRPTVAQEMTGRRQSVWHGYDADCPEHPIRWDRY